MFGYNRFQGRDSVVRSALGNTSLLVNNVILWASYIRGKISDLRIIIIIMIWFLTVNISIKVGQRYVLSRVEMIEHLNTVVEDRKLRYLKLYFLIYKYILYFTILFIITYILYYMWAYFEKKNTSFRQDQFCFDRIISQVLWTYFFCCWEKIIIYYWVYPAVRIDEIFSLQSY